MTFKASRNLEEILNCEEDMEGVNGGRVKSGDVLGESNCGGILQGGNEKDFREKVGEEGSDIQNEQIICWELLKKREKKWDVSYYLREDGSSLIKRRKIDVVGEIGGNEECGVKRKEQEEDKEKEPPPTITEKSEYGDEVIVVEVKRGRGRPKNSEINGGLAKQKKKLKISKNRGRGRPRKYPIGMAPSPKPKINKSGRGRGRQKKNEGIPDLSESLPFTRMRIVFNLNEDEKNNEPWTLENDDDELQIPALGSWGIENEGKDQIHVYYDSIVPIKLPPDCDGIPPKVTTVDSESNEESRIECPSCDSTFRSVFKLRRHTVKVHEAIQKFKFKCHLCHRNFSYANYLKFHMKSVHGAKKRKCISKNKPVCNKASTDLSVSENQENDAGNSGDNNCDREMLKIDGLLSSTTDIGDKISDFDKETAGESTVASSVGANVPDCVDDDVMIVAPLNPLLKEMSSPRNKASTSPGESLEEALEIITDQLNESSSSCNDKDSQKGDEDKLEAEMLDGFLSEGYMTWEEMPFYYESTIDSVPVADEVNLMNHENISQETGNITEEEGFLFPLEEDVDIEIKSLTETMTNRAEPEEAGGGGNDGDGDVEENEAIKVSHQQCHFKCPFCFEDFNKPELLILHLPSCQTKDNEGVINRYSDAVGEGEEENAAEEEVADIVTVAPLSIKIPTIKCHLCSYEATGTYLIKRHIKRKHGAKKITSFSFVKGKDSKGIGVEEADKLHLNVSAAGKAMENAPGNFGSEMGKETTDSSKQQTEDTATSVAEKAQLRQLTGETKMILQPSSTLLEIEESHLPLASFSSKAGGSPFQEMIARSPETGSMTTAENEFNLNRSSSSKVILTGDNIFEVVTTPVVLSTLYSCTKCEYSCSSQANLDDHEVTAHSENELEEGEEVEQEEKEKEMIETQEVAQTENDNEAEANVAVDEPSESLALNRSKRISAQKLSYRDLISGENPCSSKTSSVQIPKDGGKYQCEICEKSYFYSWGLTRHIDKEHPDKKRLKCLKCSKSFASYSELQSHKVFHIGQRSYNCPLCKKAFLYNYNSKRHMKICRKN